MGTDSTSSGFVTNRKAGKPLGKDAPHYPNKKERKLLAQICQKSGLTEEEVRKNKDHRIALSTAQKGNISDRMKRYELDVKRMKRRIAARLGVPVWHQSVLDEFNDPNYRLYYPHSLDAYFRYKHGLRV